MESPFFLDALTQLRRGNRFAAEQLLKKAWNEHTDPRANVLLVFEQHLKGNATASDVAKAAVEHGLQSDPEVAQLLTALATLNPERTSHSESKESDKYWTKERLRDAIPIDESAIGDRADDPENRADGGAGRKEMEAPEVL